MANKTVLISGASVAGPALAYWLRRYGFEPTVVERAPAPRPGGYAVDFRGTSVEVLDRMGILDEVQRAATDMGPVSYVDEHGARQADMPASVLSGEVEVLRGDLVHILYELTRRDTEYLFDDTITALTEDADGVAVTFERSAPRRFDLVVGADGLHSTVRSLSFGPERDFLHHLNYYLAIFTTENYLGLRHTGKFHNTPGRLAGMYSARNNTEAKALLYFAAPELDYDRRDQAQQKRIVAQRYAGMGWETPELLARMDRAEDFFFDSIAQVRLDSWSRGRVTLLGDAGYCASPLSGLGSSLAVVGAYVLAGELAAAGGDHRRGFAEYERQMRPFVAEAQKLAKGAGSWFVPGSKAMIRLRNLNFRMLPYLPWRRLVAELPLKAATTLRLREYAEGAARAGSPFTTSTKP